ncbi:MAG: D-alanyl-D-alanine carboxypeptidase/D-alanyl-D-alanine-endopeptidase [Phycisphaerales bacterium]|nr:D-alanyl-D-alanine carboxypeptidase/D-alanyl-D-alanine-endopeptidase [Phycisphaerales bacterium]
MNRHFTRGVTCAISAVLALSLNSVSIGATTKPDLAGAIRAEIAALGLKKAVIAVSVRDLGSQESILSVRGGEPMIPASNQKLLTTGAALVVLGENFFFKTRLLRDNDRLIVVGDGDPALGDPELLAQSNYVDAAGNIHTGLTIEHLLAAWIDAIKASGMTRVQELVIDDRIFAREGPHPLWPKDQLDEGYCAPPFGLNFHGNSLLVTAAPNAGHAPLITSISPASPWLKITNKGTSRSGKNDRNTMWMARDPQSGELTVYGNVKMSYVEPIAVGIGDPSQFLAQCLAHRLAIAGITVENARIASAVDPSPTGTPIGPILQTPIATVVTRCNVASQNLYAESLLKRLAAKSTGAPGSWATGAEAVAALLNARLGSLAGGFAISDGSGLSRGNLVTADGMTAWIGSISTDPSIGATFVESLAVAGKSGTVRKRMQDIDAQTATVQCKTGYIDRVSCLSGIVTAQDGTRFAFSVLANNLVEKDAVGKAKKLQDRVAKLIADEIAVRTRPAVGG